MSQGVCDECGRRRLLVLRLTEPPRRRLGPPWTPPPQEGRYCAPCSRDKLEGLRRYDRGSLGRPVTVTVALGMEQRPRGRPSTVIPK